MNTQLKVKKAVNLDRLICQSFGLALLICSGVGTQLAVGAEAPLNPFIAAQRAILLSEKTDRAGNRCEMPLGQPLGDANLSAVNGALQASDSNNQSAGNLLVASGGAEMFWAGFSRNYKGNAREFLSSWMSEIASSNKDLGADPVIKAALLSEGASQELLKKNLLRVANEMNGARVQADILGGESLTQKIGCARLTADSFSAGDVTVSEMIPEAAINELCQWTELPSSSEESLFQADWKVQRFDRAYGCSFLKFVGNKLKKNGEVRSNLLICLGLAKSGSKEEPKSRAGDTRPIGFGEKIDLGAKDLPQTFLFEALNQDEIIRVKTSSLDSFEVTGPSGKLDFKKSSNGETVLKFPAAGVYRLRAKGSAPVEIELSCVSRCGRKSASPRALYAGMSDPEKAKASEFINDKLSQLISDPSLRKEVINTLKSELATKDPEGLDRFPKIQVKDFGTVKIALDALGVRAKQKGEVAEIHDPVVQGDLVQLLGACDGKRTDLEKEKYLPEGMMYGHFPNLSMSDCQITQSQQLARILTALAAPKTQNERQSWVSWHGQRFTTAAGLMKGLIAAGHHVEMRDERTYANFISYTLDEKRDLRMPLWIDAGIKTKNGLPIVIPAGHSQFAWRITGPLINARVTFFHGISGAAFFAQTDTRPAWAGLRSIESIHSDNRVSANDKILAKVAGSERYLQHNRIEAKTIAKGMPAGGYGYVGVCMTSTAALEKMADEPIRIYPNIRSKDLKAPGTDAGMNRIFSLLPDDTQPVTDRRDTLRRIMDMAPFDLDSREIWDDQLRSVYRQIHDEIYP